MDIPLARGRLDAVATVLMVGYAIVLTGIVVLATVLLDGTALLVVSAVLVVAWLVHVGTYLWAWFRIRRMPSPLGLLGDGVHDRLPFTEVVLPWEAIRSVTIKPRLLRSPLLRVEPTESSRRGITCSLRILDITADELRQAFTLQSGGRIHVD